MAIYKYTNGKDTITEYNDGNHQDFEGTFDVEELFESLKESDEDFDESVWLEENGYEPADLDPVEELDNFLSIAQYVLEQGPYDGSTKDIFKMALWTYEDEYGEPTEDQANEFYSAFVEMLDTMEVA
tara:strand:+ start:66 stop:446 length:381 start_codon:yes stop_codon:yes gene_type:complete